MKRSSTKFVQIMPLGFSIIGSTVTFSSGERPRALWALLFTLTSCGSFTWLNIHFYYVILKMIQVRQLQNEFLPNSIKFQCRSFICLFQAPRTTSYMYWPTTCVADVRRMDQVIPAVRALKLLANWPSCAFPPLNSCHHGILLCVYLRQYHFFLHMQLLTFCIRMFKCGHKVILA